MICGMRAVPDPLKSVLNSLSDNLKKALAGKISVQEAGFLERASIFLPSIEKVVVPDFFDLGREYAVKRELRHSEFDPPSRMRDQRSSGELPGSAIPGKNMLVGWLRWTRQLFSQRKRKGSGRFRRAIIGKMAQ